MTQNKPKQKPETKIFQNSFFLNAYKYFLILTGRKSYVSTDPKDHPDLIKPLIRGDVTTTETDIQQTVFKERSDIQLPDNHVTLDGRVQTYETTSKDDRQQKTAFVVSEPSEDQDVKGTVLIVPRRQFSSETITRQIKELNDRGLRVIAIDPPGTGFSPALDGNPVENEMHAIKDVLSAVEEQGLAGDNRIKLIGDHTSSPAVFLAHAFLDNSFNIAPQAELIAPYLHFRGEPKLYPGSGAGLGRQIFVAEGARRRRNMSEEEIVKLTNTFDMADTNIKNKVAEFGGRQWIENAVALAQEFPRLNCKSQDLI